MGDKRPEWKERVFSNFRLYAVSDLKEEDPSFLRKVDAVFAGGADIVQLRGRGIPDRTLYKIGLEIRNLADQHQKLYFVNDRLDLALATRADGLHVGQDDGTPAELRQLAEAAGAELWIGKSTHAREQAEEAFREPVDYIGAGPVFETPTKPGYDPVGVDYIKTVARMATMPFVAIGGINLTNIRQVLEAGARRIAVVRALFEAEDPYEAAGKLRSEIDGYPI